jgi:predicted membrane-bound spermidine synthase
MLRFYIGIFLVALVTLMTELVLIRVFDVILTPNLGYMTITCALFSFGLAGICVALKPALLRGNTRGLLSLHALLLALSLLVMRPIMNSLPLDFLAVVKQPLTQIAAFSGIYLTLVVPFFLSGLIVTILISEHADKIRSLYFWDLTGAALGSVILVPFLPPIGPGGLLLCAAALSLFVSGLWSTRRWWSVVTIIGGIVLLLVPFVHAPKYFEFEQHFEKRGVKAAKAAGKIEFSRWDPIAKIDVLPFEQQNGARIAAENPKNIAYDGGAQGTIVYPFDGDYQKLRLGIESRNPEVFKENFWSLGHLVSHYLKRDRHQKVMIVGSAGGQEVKAALMYGADQVDAIEMVRTVVELGQIRYATFNGNVLNHPKVRVRIGEARSELRASREKYDVIQIYSNHTTSSIASGSGAVNPVYLQTAEAYREYFEHLTDNGVLHINHYGYPRMVTTAALAWTQMGRTDFQKHVVVFEAGAVDFLPIFLVKMQPWTEKELREVTTFLAIYPNRFGTAYKLVENPLRPEESFLAADFYSGRLPAELVKTINYRVQPATDDRPYFAFFRKRFGVEEPDPKTFMNSSMAELLNVGVVSPRVSLITMDTVHLLVTGGVSLLFAGVFIFLPLRLSDVGKVRWPRKTSSIVYFACLGSGFIIFELVFIQIFMHFIGSPLYAYSTVIFVLLLAAGVGSHSSSILRIDAVQRWTWPFLGILLSSVLILITQAGIFHIFLGAPLVVRIFVAAVMIFPLGFFLGMPFPLGILALRHQPQGAIAWAWGLNGLFTILGGLASVMISIFLGFRLTLVVAAAIYIVAFWCFASIRETSAVPSMVTGRIPSRYPSSDSAMLANDKS